SSDCCHGRAEWAPPLPDLLHIEPADEPSDWRRSLVDDMSGVLPWRSPPRRLGCAAPVLQKVRESIAPMESRCAYHSTQRAAALVQVQLGWAGPRPAVPDWSRCSPANAGSFPRVDGL